MRVLLICLFFGVAYQSNSLQDAKLAILLRELLDTIPQPENVVSTEKPETASTATSTETPTTVAKKFTDLQEAFLTPGSHFFMELMHDHCMTEKTDISIQDEFKIQACDLEDLGEKVLRIHHEIHDDDVTSIMVSRLMTKSIFTQRMKCPANIIDYAIVQLILARKEGLLHDGHVAIMNFFKEQAPKIDSAFNEYIDDLSHQAAVRLQDKMFNDTLMFTMAFGSQDVALSSHIVYYSVKYFLKNLQTTKDPEKDLQDTLMGSLWNLRCPSYKETVENHRTALSMFYEQFEVSEVGVTCSRIYGILIDYGTKVIPGYQPNYKQKELFPQCVKLHDFLKDMLDGFREYHDMLYSMDFSQLKEALKEVLGGYEYEMVDEAAHRLGLLYRKK